jgi:hypothetical protein
MLWPPEPPAAISAPLGFIDGRWIKAYAEAYSMPVFSWHVRRPDFEP